MWYEKTSIGDDDNSDFCHEKYVIGRAGESHHVATAVSIGPERLRFDSHCDDYMPVRPSKLPCIVEGDH